MAVPEGEPGPAGEDGHALLLSPSFDGREWSCCSSMLYHDHPGDTAVIVVSHSERPEELVARWRDNGGPAPGHFGAIFAGRGMADSRELTRRLRDAFEGEDVGVGAAAVPPGDLTRMDIEVSEMLGMWDAEGGRVALCLTSLTTLLQYAEISAVFRFLHATLDSFKAAAATTSTHVHLDPDAVADRDVARVRSLMDEEVDVRSEEAE